MYVRVRMYVCVCVCVRVYMRVCAYVRERNMWISHRVYVRDCGSDLRSRIKNN